MDCVSPGQIAMYYLLIILVAASRFLPHPPNVACVGALGLFAGCYLSGRMAYVVPLLALLISDVIGQAFGVAGMGFYNPIAMIAVYVGVVASVPVGRLLGGDQLWWKVPAGSLAASSLFFLISNVGVWLTPWYPTTTTGLVACFANAVPFFGYTIAGDLLFCTILFSAMAFHPNRVEQRQLAVA